MWEKIAATWSVRASERSKQSEDDNPPFRHKKTRVDSTRVLNKCLAVTYSHMGNPTLPSALLRFTAEFEKGSGGSTALLPPGKADY